MVRLPDTILGRTFGRWTVIAPAPARGTNSYVLCECECGTMKEVTRATLRNGVSKSCGCRQHDIGYPWLHERATHGDSRSPEYRSWESMKRRCYNPNCSDYNNYGGRGITVCQRWHSSYENFLSDMGRKPSPTHTLDRIDVNGPYSPENCRWALPAEQARNRRGGQMLTLNGETLPLGEWAQRQGVPYSKLYKRVRRGWSDEDVLTVP